MSMRVVVSGSTGLLGSAVMERLSRITPAIEITGLSRSGGPDLSGAQVRSIAADLSDGAAEDLLQRIAFTHFVHCAAAIPASMSGDSSARAAASNRTMDDRVISLCSRTRAKLVYVSSSSVYGMGQGPWSEESATQAPGAYACEKLRSEREAQKELPNAIIFRVPSPYGVKQRARTVLRIFIENAMRNEDLLFHGSGRRTQDFIAAQDFASAVAAALNAEDVSGIFNVGGGSPISMKNLAELVVECVPGTRSKVRPSGRADPQENYRASFPLAKAGALLDWRPGVPLRQGIGDWVRSLMSQPN